MSFDQIVSTIKKNDSLYVTVTGGEPLAQKSVIPFLRYLCDMDYSVSIETSNAYDISDIDSRVSVILDVKTPASLESDKNMISNYKKLKPIDEIKFVICNLDDFNWSRKYISLHNLDSLCPILFSPSYDDMPISELPDLILKYSMNVRLQAQLHKTIWGTVDGK